ncbi:MAG: hypothetical protein O2887_15360, partial [Bacteroidetes bacterium]|nr:hypothetical protein [Bacteroidota bacterium]
MAVSAISSVNSKLEISTIRIWWTKITHWEFWPFSVFYFPIYFYYLWLSLRARALFFFSASNPGIDYGGMLGESKMKIFNKIPTRHKPKTVLIDPGIGLNDFLIELQKLGIGYPFILKPDIGERGWLVNKIANEKQLVTYLEKVHVPFLLQEFINMEIELGVFYYRMPNEDNGHVTSVVVKEMMKVVGDGKSSVLELLKVNVRSVITLDEIEKTSGHMFDDVPSLDEEVEVVPIGNHCRGTTFLNGNHLITNNMVQAIDSVAKEYPGFHYGRFDLRCKSIEELERGNFTILELNGCGA